MPASSRRGEDLVHIRAASTGTLAAKGVTPKPRLPELFYASIVRSSGTLEIDGALLEVQPANDKDFDHFPDKDTWIADNMAASLRYRNQRDVLDCIDSDPVPSAATLPRAIYAQQVNPLAKPLCGLPFDVSCDAMAPACRDQDGDGEPEITDCDDSDNKRFHGNARPRNCCQCTDRKSCETNHAKRADLSTCQPARCDDPFDYDCTGMVVPCFVDEDCDGYSPQDPVVSQRDCDDNNPDVHPGAPKNCADSSKDWACDGNPTGGCVPCDLDGDGFQRMDAAAKCPQAGYTKQLDCDDNDRGVFPGSTMTPGASIVIVNDLKGSEGGGSAIAAMRRLCANNAVSGGAQDADCGGGRAGCPPSPTTCDRDLDGFPNVNNGTCNPAGLPVDCNDAAPVGANLNGGMVFPGAPVRCAKDNTDPLFGGQQENCSGNVRPLCMNDVDGDGWDAMFDCDNNDPNIHPWALEICDGKDNDCDGLIDEMNPDPSGNRMVETNMVGGSPVTSIKSCTDYNAGSCGQKVAATGGFSGRCVCTAISGGANAGAGKFTGCPGQPADPKSTAVAPKCFGATQPAQQTCVAGQDTDEDCDGRTNAPDGANLKEYGEVCGVETGECVAGKVNGCVRPLNKAEDATKINKFSNLAQPTAFTVSPPFDNSRRYLTCDNTAVYPAKEVCDGAKDEDCNAKVDDCSEAGFGKPSCCAGINMCLDLNTNFDHCGTCTNVCDPKLANKCVVGSCQCGTNPACAGASPLCNTTTEQCVQCLADGDCAGITGKPRCKGQNSCVQCLADGDCMGATPGCDTGTNSCVECTTNAHCAGVAGKPVCDTTAHKCVACVGNGDCPTATPVCSMNQCYQCIGNANCPMTKPICDMNACVECTVDANCTVAGKTHCSNKTCVECTMNAQCPMTKPVCDNMNKCVECTMDNQCPTDKPKCNNSVCGCAMDADCPTAKPYCKGMTVCVECTMNNQCPMAKPVCDNNACVACIDDTTCGGATPKCFNKACVECLVNTDCNGMKTCSAMHTCV
ncbi:MAG: putative metal-binding motif-containing protein [Polyangia bacterium]